MDERFHSKNVLDKDYKKLHKLKQAKNVFVGLWAVSFLGTLIVATVHTLVSVPGAIAIIGVVIFGGFMCYLDYLIGKIVYKYKWPV